MGIVVVDSDRCKACGYCVKFCPKGVLGSKGVTNRLGYRYVEPVELDKCIACAMCATMCPEGAIEVYKED